MTGDEEQWAYRLARGILRPALTLSTRRDWRGQEQLPRTGGCLVVSNHVSHADPLTFAHFVDGSGRAPRFLGKAEVFEVPVIGRLVAAAGQIPVHRETVDAAKALDAAIAAVRSGQCVVIYPEATLTRDRQMWPMMGKTGAARIALSTRCPVIPVAQWGPQDILPPYRRLPRLFFPRKLIQMRAGPAVDLARYYGREPTSEVLRAATSDIMAAITALLEQIRGERAPTERFDPRAQGVPRIGDPRLGDAATDDGEKGP